MGVRADLGVDDCTECPDDACTDMGVRADLGVDDCSECAGEACTD